MKTFQYSVGQLNLGAGGCKEVLSFSQAGTAYTSLVFVRDLFALILAFSFGNVYFKENPVKLI